MCLEHGFTPVHTSTGTALTHPLFSIYSIKATEEEEEQEEGRYDPVLFSLKKRGSATEREK